MFFRTEMPPDRPMQPQHRGNYLLLPSCQFWDHEGLVNYRIEFRIQQPGQDQPGKLVVAEMDISGWWRVSQPMKRPAKHRIFCDLRMFGGILHNCGTSAGLIDKGLRTPAVAAAVDEALEQVEKWRLKLSNRIV